MKNKIYDLIKRLEKLKGEVGGDTKVVYYRGSEPYKYPPLNLDN